MQITLRDADSSFQGEQQVEIKMERGNPALLIEPRGFGCFGVEGDSAPVLLELYQGRLRLLVWPKIDEQQPTIIDLKNARRRDEQAIESAHQE